MTMIYRKIPYYNFENLNLSPLESAQILKGSFYISLPKLPCRFSEEKVMLSIPNALELRVIKRSLTDDTGDIRSLTAEGCFYFNDSDEWILEAVCHMQTPDGSAENTYVLRLPLSAPFVKDAEIGVYFDGVWIRFMKDGRVLNENSGLDRFCTPNGEIFIDEALAGVKVAAVDAVTVEYREEKSDVSPAFYFPHGWNTYVGDVMSFTHDGVYHLMYLIDRRHHGSRNGCGAHYICHLTTKDLVDWYEQKPIAEIDEPWLTYGTGTMLYHNGKYYMTYGLHTERYAGKTEKLKPPYDPQTERFENITYADAFEKGGLPTGAAYSVSDDGIDFKPAKVLFHSARNPSAYTNEKGGITLYCGYGGEGVFESSGFDRPFKRSPNHFDFVRESVMKNTSECPALFSWNGYKYLIVGFTGYFRTMEPYSDRFVDAAALGENVYDGLSVPMVAEFAQNRRLIAGWVQSPNRGWGGVLMQRELIQEENGKLGMKWIPELTPAAKGEDLLKVKDALSQAVALEKYKSYYLNLTVDPGSAQRFGISLNNGEAACTVELELKEKRVQVNSAAPGAFAERLPTMLEQMRQVNESVTVFTKSGVTDIPQNAFDYALPDIEGLDKPFTFKVLLRYSKRLRSTVIDAEIAERRTLISVRHGFFPTELSLLKDGELTLEKQVLTMF